MIIGHLPAGYVLSKLIVRRFEPLGISAKTFLWAGVIGAIAPDFDMLYFHLIDQRQHHHHTYPTHYPVLWLVLFIASVIWLYLARKKDRVAYVAVFSLSGFAHMFSDTIVGDIWWLAPWIDQPVAFFTVPALYRPWWLNFLLHWSFTIELAVVSWAIYLWRKPTPAESSATPLHHTSQSQKQ